MRRILFFLLFIFIFPTNIFSQFKTDNINYTNKIELQNSNTWAIEGGFTNFIMHGDLRSIGTSKKGSYLNFGGFLSVTKMFNPVLGLEFKLNYNKMAGASQLFSSVYDVLYASGANNENLWFKGKSYGGEINMVLSFTNLYFKNKNKWNLVGYFGAGYHQYTSALYETLPNGVDKLHVDFAQNSRRGDYASSIFFTAQLGLKRRISNKVDLELRPSAYLNNEDHLDATISNKQNWEMFFVTHLGISIKLGKQKIFTLWGGNAKTEIQDFQIIDTDGDGVMDQLDKEPNTPKGVLVYGNGIAIDSDKDGIPDYKDKCPLKFGLITNNGCPIAKDTDGDGILDEIDLCPTVKGPQSNHGCPKLPTIEKQNIQQKIGTLAANIYFDSNKAKIKPVSLYTLDKIIKLMKKVPTIKFVIEGHTDNKMSDRYNLLLSQKRAVKVKTYLLRNGIDSSRLTSIGYGESRPRYSNDTPGGRQLNRRVEIKPIEEK